MKESQNQSAKKASATTETPLNAHSIGEALALLDRAAQRSSEEVKKMLTDDYDSLRKTLSEVTPQIRDAVRGFSRQSVDVIRNTKDQAMDAVNRKKDQAVEAVRNTTDQALNSGREAAQAVDASAHENAWMFIGGAALAAGLAGYLLGRGGRN